MNNKWISAVLKNQWDWVEVGGRDYFKGDKVFLKTHSWYYSLWRGLLYFPKKTPNASPQPVQGKNSYWNLDNCLKLIWGLLVSSRTLHNLSITFTKSLHSTMCSSDKLWEKLLWHLCSKGIGTDWTKANTDASRPRKKDNSYITLYFTSKSCYSTNYVLNINYKWMCRTPDWESYWYYNYWDVLTKCW